MKVARSESNVGGGLTVSSVRSPEIKVVIATVDGFHKGCVHNFG